MLSMFTKKKPAASTASVPSGERVYAVGDIHGRADLLRELLRMIARYDGVRPPARTTVIFLGDYIDRGADSKGVVDLLINGIPEGMKAVYLSGNHEDMMLQAFADLEAFRFWTVNGGIAALASYGVEADLLHGKFGEGMSKEDAPKIMSQFAKLLPPEHSMFFRDLQTSVTIGDYYFVHAGVRPGVALEKQSRDDCLYIRQEFLRHGRDFGKVVVHGHTPRFEPDVQPNRIGIDTMAHRSGRLTALCLEGTERTFLAT
jgi:serine/threonine protein phosphatase 1